MDPALSTGLVIPTYALWVKIGEQMRLLNILDMYFATCFQQILAPPKWVSSSNTKRKGKVD